MSEKSTPVIVVIFIVCLVVGIFVLNNRVMKEIEQTQQISPQPEIKEARVQDNRVEYDRPEMSSAKSSAAVEMEDTAKEESEQKTEKKIIYELPLEDVILVQ